MPTSRPLQLAAVLAGAGAFFGAGVAIGRGTARCGTPSALWPEDIITLTYQGLDIHRLSLDRYVGHAGESSWTLARDPKGARFRVGPATITAAEWRVITGMLDAAWSLLEVVPRTRRVHNLRLALNRLPLVDPWSLTLAHPVKLLRVVKSREFVVVDRDQSESIPHLTGEERVQNHVRHDLTRRQWVLYTGILEAAWLVGETMDGSIGGGPADEGQG